MRRFRVLFAAALVGLTGLAASTFAVPAVSAVTPTTLYAVDSSDQTVVKVVGGATGTFTRTVIGRNLSSVASLASDADGNVYLLNNGRLVRISADGVQRSVAANLTGLGWMVVDPHRTVFDADGHRVIRIWQPSGKQSVMGSVTSRTIEGLGLDGSGQATVAFGNWATRTSRWRPSRPPPGARRRSGRSAASPTTEREHVSWWRPRTAPSSST